MHEGYERKTHTNDIALLQLRAKVPFNAFIWPICLPPSNIILENQLASVTGECSYNLNMILIFLRASLYSQVGVPHPLTALLVMCFSS